MYDIIMGVNRNVLATWLRDLGDRVWNYIRGYQQFGDYVRGYRQSLRLFYHLNHTEDQLMERPLMETIQP